MSSKKGFFCELPIDTIAKIKRLARKGGDSQGDVITRVMAKVPDVKELTGRKAAKVNGQEILARALVKDAEKPKGTFTRTFGPGRSRRK
jgi:hypothetical protein